MVTTSAGAGPTRAPGCPGESRGSDTTNAKAQQHDQKLLLAQPGLAAEVEPPYGFLRLDKPGVALLAELIDIVRSRPGINPAMLVEHFAERPEYPSLQKLMAAMSVGEPEMQRTEFFDALKRMEDQAVTQRRDALTSKSREGALDSAEKAELRELLAARHKPCVASD